LITKVVLDLEANALNNPTQIWVVVCKDLASGQVNSFKEKDKFLEYSKTVDLWIGHNFLEYDYPTLNKLWGFTVEDIADKTIDTLILSRLIDYSRPEGHSIEAYGEEFGLEKISFSDFSHYSPQMETYCIRDVDICEKIYLKYLFYISNPNYRASILLEHRFQLIVNSLHNNGFCFDVNKANRLLDRITGELVALDTKIVEAFPPRLVFFRKVRRNLDGTLHKVDLRLIEENRFSIQEDSLFNEVCFNASSHKQVVDLLREAGWSPVEKTDTHKDIEREVNILKYKPKDKDIDLKLEGCYKKLEILKVYGWKISEENLATLPKNAPEPARLLAKRRLLKSRQEDLVEWRGLVQEDGRIHGNFLGIGAWTHRMAHRRPNMANIPNEKDEQGRLKLYGKEFRSLWIAPKNRLLIGVDAEGIQLRVFAHYINDKEFTNALVLGKKADKTDPHSLNQKVLGSVCRHRQAAKRFVYALLLGAGLSKLSQVLECSDEQTKEALANLLRRYTGFKYLKESVIPTDAKRGYFIGLDRRKVAIPGDTMGIRRHLCMSGYLQNGEAIIMKKATLKWLDKIERIFPKENAIKLVNLVHDEWQTECPNNMEVAIAIAKEQAKSLEETGIELGLNCPLSGSFWNDERNDYTIGTNWKVTH